MSTRTTETRSLGVGGRQLSAVGVGTWALGGPFTFDGRDAGWGEVDDAESVRALHTAIDAGVTLIDTAHVRHRALRARHRAGIGRALDQGAGVGRRGHQVRPSHR
jgi:aryl-alcohol dehydrogenase-like predicted oxidoreductase